MAKIALPNNPTDGQKVIDDNKVYAYDSSKGRWSTRTFSFIGKMPVDIEFGLPELSLSSNTVNIDSIGRTFFIKYDIENDVDVKFERINLGNANVEYFSTNNTIRITSDANEFNGTLNVIASNGRRKKTTPISIRAKYGVDGSLIRSLDIPQPGGGFDTDGTYFYIGDKSVDDNNGNVKIYDIETGQLVSTITNPNFPTTSTPTRFGINFDQFGHSLAIKPDGTKIAVAAPYEDQNSSKSDTGVVHIIDVATGTREITLNHSPDIQLLNSPNNELLSVVNGSGTDDCFIVRNNNSFGRDIAIDWNGNVLSSFGWDSSYGRGSTHIIDGSWVTTRNNSSHPSTHLVSIVDNFNGTSFSATRTLDASAQVQPGNLSTAYYGGISATTWDDTYIYVTKYVANPPNSPMTVAALFLYDVNTFEYVGVDNILGKGWNTTEPKYFYYNQVLGFNTKAVSSAYRYDNAGIESSGALFVTDNSTLTTTTIACPDAAAYSQFGAQIGKLTNTSFYATAPGVDKIYIYE